MGRADIEDAGGEDGLRAMGLASWEAQFESERQIVRVANSIVT
jgi:hypothetical protein